MFYIYIFIYIYIKVMCWYHLNDKNKIRVRIRMLKMGPVLYVFFHWLTFSLVQISLLGEEGTERLAVPIFFYFFLNFCFSVNFLPYFRISEIKSIIVISWQTFKNLKKMIFQGLWLELAKVKMTKVTSIKWYFW